MSDLAIALVQMRCEKAAITANLATIAHYTQTAINQQIDSICFPEMCITGYADPTRFPQALLRLDGPEVAQVVALTRNLPITIIAGLIEANPAGKPYITQFVARDGRLLGYYRKITIIDEECAWFTPGTDVPVFTHNDCTFGLAICADIGNPQVFERSAQQGAQLIFEAAAPGLYGEQATRNWQTGFAWWRNECQTKLGHYARANGVWIAVATQAGRTIDEDFPGGGYVFAPDGTCTLATPDWHEGMLCIVLHFE